MTEAEERAAFEAWSEANGHGTIDDMLGPLDRILRNLLWSSWQARAALSAPPEEIKTLGLTIEALQNTLRARNEEIQMLRNLYCEAESSKPDAPPGWQPISTAPRDGEQVLLRVRTKFHKRTAYFAAQGYWAHQFWVIFNADEAVQRVEPTHWMPLPAAPSPQEPQT